jgi:hypothetical protein
MLKEEMSILGTTGSADKHEAAVKPTKKEKKTAIKECGSGAGIIALGISTGITPKAS